MNPSQGFFHFIANVQGIEIIMLLSHRQFGVHAVSQVLWNFLQPSQEARKGRKLRIDLYLLIASYVLSLCLCSFVISCLTWHLVWKFSEAKAIFSFKLSFSVSTAPRTFNYQIPTLSFSGYQEGNAPHAFKGWCCKDSFCDDSRQTFRSITAFPELLLRRVDFPETQQAYRSPQTNTKCS